MADVMEDVHGAIERALNARSDYVIKEAASITLQKARRLLEQDLNVEQGFLDPHKDFIKDLINKLLQGAQAENPETQEPEESKEPEGEEESADQKPPPKRLKKKADGEEVKEEVVVGVASTDEGVKKSEVDSPLDGECDDVERLIEEAIRKRVPHFVSQADSLTVLGVRRLLEQDLSLEKGALDAHKQHIRKVLDQVLNTEDEEAVPVSNVKKRKAVAPKSKSKASKVGKKRKGMSSEEDGSSEGERAPKVRKSAKQVVQEEDEDASGDEDDDDVEPSKEVSSGVEESDGEEAERKKVAKPKKVVEAKPVYGKKVEHLKSTIKACGITVPPSVYKKAKQAPEERREAVLIKELEAILSKEGLTASSSKDDIKAVRKRKEKLKDLEGIDASNIIGESRGRRSRASANSFFAPQRSEPVDLGDEDEDEDEEEEDEEDEDQESDPEEEMEDDDDL